MILLDTNVVSEAMKPAPDPSVLDWLNAQAAETLYLSTVTLAEMLFGLAAPPAGKRKQRLTRAFDGLMALFADRLLTFDAEAARHYAALTMKARNQGRGFPTPDGYIAAIAASRDFLVTPHIAAVTGDYQQTLLAHQMTTRCRDSTPELPVRKSPDRK